MTITAWVYPTSSSDNRTICEKGWNREFDFALQSGNPSKLIYTARSSTSDSNWYGIRSEAIIGINTWTHVAVTRETSTSIPKLYINGINVMIRNIPPSKSIINFPGCVGKITSKINTTQMNEDGLFMSN